jgi:hypothetical protein
VHMMHVYTTRLIQIGLIIKIRLISGLLTRMLPKGGYTTQKRSHTTGTVGALQSCTTN